MSSLYSCCAGDGCDGNTGGSSCRAKSDASANWISEREARKSVGGVPRSRQLELDDEVDEDEDEAGGGGGGESGEGWAVASVEVILLAADERWESCW